MSIRHLLQNKATIKRLENVQGSKKQSFQTHLVDIKCAIQQEEPDAFLQQDGYVYNRYLMFCLASIDVQTGDKVFFESEDYLVRGVTEYKMGISGSGKFKQVSLRKENDYA